MEHSNEPVGFSFQLSFDEPNAEAEASFREVSGISVTTEITKIVEGGDNSFQHRVPSRTIYNDLVLKRGFVLKNSALFTWCYEILHGNLSSNIQTKNIFVNLMDENAAPLVQWQFFNAWPVKWTIADLDTTDNEVIIETIEFAYSYFERMK